MATQGIPNQPSDYERIQRLFVLGDEHLGRDAGYLEDAFPERPGFNTQVDGPRTPAGIFVRGISGEFNGVTWHTEATAEGIGVDIRRLLNGNAENRDNQFKVVDDGIEKEYAALQDRRFPAAPRLSLEVEYVGASKKNQDWGRFSHLILQRGLERAYVTRYQTFWNGYLGHIFAYDPQRVLGYLASSNVSLFKSR